MDIIIKGYGCIIPASPIPDSVLALAYPYFTIEDAPDGGLWFELSPYVEVYDEDKIRSFLLSLLPFSPSGKINCSLTATSGEHKVVPIGKWTFELRGGDLFRNDEGSGSFITSSCLNR